MIYIHIPFCKGKCIYCDFYSGGNPDWEKYLRAVASELTERIVEFRGDCLTSIYVGGGTPSLIPPDQFLDFMGRPETNDQDNEKLEGSFEPTKDVWGILKHYNIPISEEIEVTLEVNPEDITIERAEAWREAGINRISMGVQSLNNNELKTLKRRHNAEKVKDAISILKQYFNNISLDFIYGIPGQTTQTLIETIEKALSFAPTHISTYALSYEPKTVLTFLRDKGEVSECTEEKYIAFDNLISSLLEKAGYERYEISNYSLPGYHSRHNTGYWTGKPYIGLGPSASSYDGHNKRRTNFSDIHRYLNHSSNSGTKIYEEETLNEAEKIEEKIMLGLRTKSGVDLTTLKPEIAEELKERAQKWIKLNDLILEQNKMKLTKKGIYLSDRIILDLVQEM